MAKPKWIRDAIKGDTSKMPQLGTPAGQNVQQEKLSKAMPVRGKMGRRGRFAPKPAPLSSSLPSTPPLTPPPLKKF